MILNDFKDAVITCKFGRGITFINPVAEEITGWEKDEVVGRDLDEILMLEIGNAREELGSVIERVKRAKRVLCLETPAVLTSRDGQRVPVDGSVAPVRDMRGEVIGITVLLFRDGHYASCEDEWTQRYRCHHELLVEYRTEELRNLNEQLQKEIRSKEFMEDALRQSSMKFRNLVMNIPCVIYQRALDLFWTMYYMSDEIERITGYAASDFVKDIILSYKSIIHPEDREHVEETIERQLGLHRSFEIEYRILHRDGSMRWVSEKGRGVYGTDGTILWVDGSISDITESREVQRELREYRERLEEIVEERTRELEEVNELLREDIQERERAEELLRESEELHRIILSSISDAVFITDDNGFFTFICPNVRHIFGCSFDEVRERGTIHSLLGEDFLDMEELQEAGEIANLEVLVKSGTDRRRTLLVTVKSVDIKGGTLLYSCRDITERKTLEERQRLATHILELINRIREKGELISQIIATIRSHEDLYGVCIKLIKEVMQTGNEMITRNEEPPETEKYCDSDHEDFFNIIEDEPFLECMNEAVLNGRVNPSLLCFTDNGSFWTNSAKELFLSPVTCDVSGSDVACMVGKLESIAIIPIRWGKRIIGLLQLFDRRCHVFTPDIIHFFEGVGSSIGTALMWIRAGEQLKESLNEKEVLLREIHHRVKNNMQVVSSLINLQAKRISDDAVREIFTECKNRIYSMALVHEKLYKSSDLANVDFAQYVDELTTRLISTYNNPGSTINLRSDISDVRLGVDVAVPCSLIINELISNSLKHAFPDGSGEIHIEFTSNNGNYYLAVSDNGIGIPDIDLENCETLGVQLVTGLAKQIGGTIDLDNRSGTRFSITFPANR